MANLDAITDSNGKLPAFAWPGGYPLFYLDGENFVICPACANMDGPATLETYAVNWEDPNLYCDTCTNRIESAYAEDQADNG